MKSARSISFFTSILVVAFGIAGFLWWEHHSRPLYGKASLSEEEKRILSMITADCEKKGFIHVAHSIGMICLKHRLTSSEIDRLFPEWVPHKRLCVCRSPFLLLFFNFDAQGNIVSIYYVDSGRSHSLPPLESVTTDAPIDLPPLPRKNGFYTEAAHAIQYSRMWQPGGIVVTTPPDFASLSYTDAKTAVDVTLLDMSSTIPYVRLGAEYPRKIVDQLKAKSLTDDKIALAIYLLGSIKPQDTNSIAALIERIDFKVNVSYSDTNWLYVSPWSLYPARDALLRIGEVSVGPIVQKLPGETNSLCRQLLCAVVSTFGRTNWVTAWQPKTAIDQLQRLRATESELSRRHNIDEALGLLIDNKVDLNIGWSGYWGE